jgi:hypothetical protein
MIINIVAAPRGGACVPSAWVSCVAGVARQCECLLLEGVSGSLDRQVRVCCFDGEPYVATTRCCTTTRTHTLVRSGIYIWMYVVRRVVDRSCHGNNRFFSC